MIAARVENNHRARRRAFAPHFCASLLRLTAAAGDRSLSLLSSLPTLQKWVTRQVHSKISNFASFRLKFDHKHRCAKTPKSARCNPKILSELRLTSERVAFFCASLFKSFCASPEPTFSTPLQIAPCFFLRLTKKLILATKVCNKGVEIA
jgi:hypothetical protein